MDLAWGDGADSTCFCWHGAIDGKGILTVAGVAWGRSHGNLLLHIGDSHTADMICLSDPWQEGQPLLAPRTVLRLPPEQRPGVGLPSAFFNLASPSVVPSPVESRAADVP